MLTHHDVVLPNGLRVVLVPQPAVHRAVAALYLRVGSRFEAAENNGISHFLEHMSFRGTPSMASAATRTTSTGLCSAVSASMSPSPTTSRRPPSATWLRSAHA